EGRPRPAGGRAFPSPLRVGPRARKGQFPEGWRAAMAELLYNARFCGEPRKGKGLALGPSRRKIDLRKTLFLLPNLITLLSLVFGFDSILTSATANGDEDFSKSALLLVFALFCDMLDGRVARLTKTQSAFGLQIDSLADVVSFGVAPAILVYKCSLSQT